MPGLDDYPGNHPPVFAVFWGFRIMVGTGLLMLAVSWIGRLVPQAPPQRCRGWSPMRMVPMALSGWVASLAGWYTTEIGRQPWLVTGILKTADALGPVPGSHVALTLAVYLILYVAADARLLGVLVRLSLKAAKDGDASPLPGVRDRGAGATGCRRGE